MSINGILNTGSRGMMTSQLQTQVTSGNITGASVEGYVRRSPTINPDASLLRQQTATRVVEPFIERRVLNAQSSASEAAASRVAVDVLDSILEEGDGSLGDALDAFQVSVQNLAAQPDDVPARQQLLATAENVATSFRSASARIEEARTDNRDRIIDSVSQVNQRLHQITKLGVEIQKSESDGFEASNLRDQRDLLIKDVAERVPVTVMDHGNGRISLLLAGQHTLVAPEGRVTEIGAVQSSNGDVTITTKAAGATVDITKSITSGSIGGQLKAAAGPIAAAHQKLDQLATDVANSYNQVHREGIGLDGSTGIDLFEPPVTIGNVARFMAVSSQVANAPEKIAAATEADKLPSDNRNAAALSALAERPVAQGGQTLNEALASFVGFAGTTVQTATQAEQFQAGALEQVSALRESVSGVSSDEEMVAMMKYQRAYQASLRVIQTADEMYGDLLALR
jgi:flagellar hook-associated protein 1